MLSLGIVTTLLGYKGVPVVDARKLWHRRGVIICCNQLEYFLFTCVGYLLQKLEKCVYQAADLILNDLLSSVS